MRSERILLLESRQAFPFSSVFVFLVALSSRGLYSPGVPSHWDLTFKQKEFVFCFVPLIKSAYE